MVLHRRATESVSFFTAVKPVISSYTPVTATIGAEVTITGQNFNPIAEKNLVSFGATRATVLSSSSTEIKVKVPAGASFGPISLLDAESGLTAESVQEFVPTFTGEFKKNESSTQGRYQWYLTSIDRWCKIWMAITNPILLPAIIAVFRFFRM